MLLEAKLSGKGKKTGVDLGLTKLAALSDTSYVQYPKFLKQAENKLKQQQRSLSQKAKKKGFCQLSRAAESACQDP